MAVPDASVSVTVVTEEASVTIFGPLVDEGIVEEEAVEEEEVVEEEEAAEEEAPLGADDGSDPVSEIHWASQVGCST